MAKAIMIQGTMSNAGKSLVSAALCRIFRQDGYRCAPFKAQNMALNSFVTSDGLEMGRAQVMQAEAAGIEPSVLMNPVLLKPSSDTGSQVIVMGEVMGDMSAADYFRRKKELVPVIMNAYNELAADCDIIVIEGAGSPAELNLAADDIVNMGMARRAKSPVLLVGDIDRGGIFAQLLGTLMLLEKEEQSMVRGLIVNKFRGDKEIFKSGTDILEQRSGKPVAGVIPYIDCDIDDEDSLSERLIHNSKDCLIEIAVIRLPRISNFTDFDVFSRFSGVSVRYITKAGQLKCPDMIIIPGTKSTVSDMKWLRESGIEAEIKSLADSGIPVWGICGGYQILGNYLSDINNCEGGDSVKGMGLLNSETVFESQKIRTRTKGRFSAVGGIFSSLNGTEFYGYEIHNGRTIHSGADMLTMENGSGDGATSGNIYGCYVHGIFDNSEVADKIIRSLCAERGVDFTEITVRNVVDYKNMQYDILADEVRKNTDMELIYRIIENGI